jgi:hypothetical protein
MIKKHFPIYLQCLWHWWCTLKCEYLCELSKNFEMEVFGLSGTGEKMIREKHT